MTKKISFTVLLVLVAWAAVYLRAYFEAKNFLVEARAAKANQNISAAIANYGRALNWFSAWIPPSREAVLELATLARLEKDVELQKQAWTELRRALYRSRNFLRPENGADKSPFFIMAEENLRLLANTAGSGKAIKEIGTFEPHYLRQIFGAVAFLAWIITGVATIFAGFDREAKLRPRPFGWGLGLTLVAFVLWLFLLGG